MTLIENNDIDPVLTIPDETVPVRRRRRRLILPAVAVAVVAAGAVAAVGLSGGGSPSTSVGTADAGAAAAQAAVAAPAVVHQANPLAIAPTFVPSLLHMVTTLDTPPETAASGEALNHHILQFDDSPLSALRPVLPTNRMTVTITTGEGLDAAGVQDLATSPGAQLLTVAGQQLAFMSTSPTSFTAKWARGDGSSIFVHLDGTAVNRAMFDKVLAGLIGQ